MKSSPNKGKQKKDERKTASFPGYFAVFTRNILFGFLAFLLILLCYKQQPGYKWTYDNLLRGNMEVIKKYRHLSTDKRNEMKIGFTYVYLRYLKQNTPDSAVILMPRSPAFRRKDVRNPFGGEPWHKIWAARFLYPRKIVYEGEKDNKYADHITHVAIVNGWGYDQLDYQVAQKVDNTVLPLHWSPNKK